MKKTTLLFVVAGLFLLFALYGASQHGQPPGNNDTCSFAAGIPCTQPPPPIMPPPSIPPPPPNPLVLSGSGVSIVANTMSVTGPFNLQATHPNATSVEFYVDSVWQGRDTTSPYTLYPAPTALSYGNHSLIAIAYVGTYPGLQVVGYREYTITSKV